MRILKIVISVLLLLIMLPLMIASCGITESDVYFPVEKVFGLPKMDLLGRGWLVFEGGCLRVKPPYFFGKSYLLIWPYGYSFDIKGREVRVINEKGEVVARTGHWMKYGGGPAANMEIVEKHLGEPIPEDKYPGPYFIVSEVKD